MSPRCGPGLGMQAPPLATNNETLIAIIANEDIVNIERVIAVFSPAAAVIFYNKCARTRRTSPSVAAVPLLWV